MTETADPTQNASPAPQADAADIAGVLARAPYAELPETVRAALAESMRPVDCAAGAQLYAVGDKLAGLYAIVDGRMEVRDENGAILSLLGPGDHFGEQGLMREGLAVTSAVAEAPSRLLVTPAAVFQSLRAAHPAFEAFFKAEKREAARPTDLTATPIAELMTQRPLTCSAKETIQAVAQMMRDSGVSCILISDSSGALRGIITNSDLTHRALAAGLPRETPVSAVMTPNPVALSSDAIGGDVLFEMLERGIGHVPVVKDGALVGIVTETDLTRLQALSSATMIKELYHAEDAAGLARLTARIPTLLAQLVGAGHRHDVVTRLITDIADAATRRLLQLAEAELGPPPVPYLWLACGSQGRREQSGVSDQDNCLFIDDAATEADDAYFEALARVVSDGLAECGYVYCPGDMMATNPRWRQPVKVWREYFAGWIAKADPMAQMLASVMFDLRPIGGEAELFEAVIGDVLERASGNSIFVTHMIRNAVGHAPPLGLFGGVATIRSGEHKETVDLKHNGVVAVVDLARIYALQGKLRPVNTRARLEAALEAKLVSPSGGRDLIDAYDLIAETRLRHQARQAREGKRLDNFMAPGQLSDLERNHLRDAFVVVRTMQSALTHSRAAVM